MFSKLTSSALTISGVLVALAIVFPSVQPVNLLAGAGVLAIAVGLAFQDILQNLLAGVLLLFRQPFKDGDQIEVGDVVGTVEEIAGCWCPTSRSTPTSSESRTAKEHIRASFVVGISYESDMDRARRVATEAIRSTEGVAAEPPAEVLYTELGDSTLNLEVLLWCDSHQLEMRRTVARGIEAVKRAFDREGIEIPCPVVALQATSSFQTALSGRPVTPGGAVGDDGQASPVSPQVRVTTE